MFEEYRIHLKELLDQAEIRLKEGEDRLDQKLKIENIYLMLVSDQRLLEASIQKSYYQLAFVVDLEEDKWSEFGIVRLPFPELGELPEIDPKELEALVLQKSPEMMQFRYLIAAAKYSARSRFFDFLSPYGGKETSLGFGYMSQIKIGRSRTREMETRMEELQANLKLAVYKLAQDHNTALSYYKNILLGLENAKKWFGFLTRRFFEGGEYDAQEFLDAIASILQFHGESLNLGYNFMLYEAIEDRLLLRGPYPKLLNSVPLKPVKLGLKRKWENLKIKKAVKA